MTNQIQSFSKIWESLYETGVPCWSIFEQRERETEKKKKERERKRKERRKEKGGKLNISNGMFHRSPKAIMSRTN